MVGLTSEEITAVNQLREKLADILPEIKDDFDWRDDSLAIWVRETGMNVNKAEEMFRSSMKWRLENNIGVLRDSSVDIVYAQKFPYFLDGLSKLGDVVLTIPFGTWDIRAGIESDGDASKIIRHFSQMLEKTIGEIKRKTLENSDGNGEHARIQCILILDVAGLSYRQVTNVKAVQALMELSRVAESHYPGIMRNVFMIKAPAVFSMLFRAVKPFLSGRTLDILQVFPDKKDKWQPAILELIESSQIRERFGGSKPE